MPRPKLKQYTNYVRIDGVKIRVFAIEGCTAEYRVERHGTVFTAPVDFVEGIIECEAEDFDITVNS